MAEKTKIITNSADQTRQAGAALGRVLKPGDLVGLYGRLGAGKTVFVQGMAEGMGIDEAVTSPSYVLVHRYRGRVDLVHVDLYRLSRIEAEELGLAEYLEGAAGVVEWAERLEGMEVDVKVSIGVCEGEATRREIEIEMEAAK